MSTHSHERYNPDLFSVPRLTTLFASIIVALGSGTNYVHSGYAPQLGARLKLNNMQLNVIGLAGNFGAVASAPAWGRVIDARGPRISLASAFCLLFTGYFVIYLLYKSGFASDQESLPFTFLLLTLCSCIKGMGSIAGVGGGINSTAKTFPDSARASTVGLVVSGIGLSAFLFSTISRVFFPGDTPRFLLLLSFGTALPMILGFFLVRPIPLSRSTQRRGSNTFFEDEANFLNRTVISDERVVIGPRTPLLQHDDLDEVHERESVVVCGAESVDQRMPTRQSSNDSDENTSRSRFLSRRRALLLGDVSLTNMFGKGLAKSTDFWLLFVIKSLLSGTGFMYINNVGSMSQALYAKHSPKYDDIEASKWQATQVSTISVMNCTGRIVMGLISDYGKSKLGISRSTSLILVSFLFFISQVAAANIGNVHNLWIASALLGLGHGSVFSLFAIICLEWFGMPHFSENYGYLQLAPIFAGNLFSVVFGRTLDAHETVPGHVIHVPHDLATRNAPPRCLLGKECYVDALYLTMSTCFLGILLSMWACLRDREKLRKASMFSGES